MRELESRWGRFWYSLTAGYDASASWEELQARYQEPHRAYHTLAHIADCLRELDGVWERVVARQEVEFALWHHDVIYDPRGKDNEERSAGLAVQVAADAGLPEPFQRRVETMILATKYHMVEGDPDAAVLIDVDLSILGRAPEVFDDYERQIRREYSWMPDEDFAAGRTSVLERFIARPALYLTKVFQERCERQARANIRRSITNLNNLKPEILQ